MRPDDAGLCLSHAERQAGLYRGIWSADPDYGTRHADVVDTVAHRIVPHMRRVLAGRVSVVDFGAGDGRFLRELHRALWCARGLGIDLHEPQTDDWMEWMACPLWEAEVSGFDYAISTDVLEHMPPDMVPAVMERIAASASHGFLRISTRQDIYGTQRGLHLHETIREPDWWLERCREAGIEPSSWRVYPGHAVEVWW